MVRIEKIPRLFRKKGKPDEVKSNLKVYAYIERDLKKMTKSIEKGKSLEENFKYIDHLKIALQFKAPKELRHIKVSMNE
ncbi:MAG: hypothetical protein DRJ64_04385 [Thermoprotei archaeon]|nr:MAG: hypothetical protein B6U94_03465 [Thermofilum sp. ex4484_79]RLF06513.1 MAG: hypothetical protein DRJ64_04385 [Thermoprotei archaeon]